MLHVSEIVALVDRSGAVTGSAERSVVRRHNLLHAATAVLVRDPAGRIYVHRRSPDKDWAPSHHDAAAGGIMGAGEEPAPAAARELAEELGVSGAELRPLGLNVYEDDTTRCVEHCFETTWAGPVRHAGLGDQSDDVTVGPDHLVLADPHPHVGGAASHLLDGIDRGRQPVGRTGGGLSSRRSESEGRRRL